jgi:dTDP-4-amino-4,6-dideoxygalactose transaminase
MIRYPNQIGVGGLVISQREKELVNQVLDSNQLTYSNFTRTFERMFAELHDVSYSLFVNSGTSALHIALQALKIQNGWVEGDEILVPAVTFVATSNIVIHNNLKPVFVDVDPRTYNLDAGLIEEKINERTKAIIPVHLLGLPADMPTISAIAKKYNLKIIEDSAECMFASINNQKVGSFGDIGCFSTYVAHYIVTGVGGLATTNSPELAVKMRSLMNHGRNNIYLSSSDDNGFSGEKLHEIVEKRFRFEEFGHSFRATELEAALGIGQLENYQEILSRRKKNATQLIAGLSDLTDFLQLPFIPDGFEHTFMLFGIVAKGDFKRNLVNFLEDRNIETRDLLPLINQPIYIKRFGDLTQQYPVAHQLNNNAFYIGCHPFMSQNEIDFVIESFHDFFRSV